MSTPHHELQVPSGGSVSLIVAAIRCYQKLAPERVRGSCRFTPTCSEYTILCIQKHGLIRGLNKSLRRLLACRPPNGGTDHP